MAIRAGLRVPLRRLAQGDPACLEAQEAPLRPACPTDPADPAHPAYLACPARRARLADPEVHAVRGGRRQCTPVRGSLSCTARLAQGGTATRSARRVGAFPLFSSAISFRVFFFLACLPVRVLAHFGVFFFRVSWNRQRQWWRWRRWLLNPGVLLCARATSSFYARSCVSPCYFGSRDLACPVVHDHKRARSTTRPPPPSEILFFSLERGEAREPPGKKTSAHQKSSAPAQKYHWLCPNR